MRALQKVSVTIEGVFQGLVKLPFQIIVTSRLI